MPLMDGRAYYVTLRAMQSAQIIENQLLYYTAQDDDELQAFDVADKVTDLWTTGVMPQLSQKYQLLEVEYFGTYNTGSGIIPAAPNTLGSISGDVLPAFLSGTCRKFPSFDAQEGVAAGSIRRGFLRLAGIPENVQDNGQLTNTVWEGNLNAALLPLVSITGLPNQTSTLHLCIQRRNPANPNGVPLAVAPVIALRFQKFGTQNTRKR